MYSSSTMHVVSKFWMSELFYEIINVSNSSLENVLSEKWENHQLSLSTEPHQWLSMSTRPRHWISMSIRPRHTEVIPISHIHECMRLNNNFETHISSISSRNSKKQLLVEFAPKRRGVNKVPWNFLDFIPCSS